MSTARVALGWGVLNAVHKAPAGRLVVLSGYYWLADDRYAAYPGYDGYGGDQYREFHDPLQQGIVKWLTGKTTGASCLVMMNDPTTVGYEFGQEFQAGLVRNGHTVTLTGNESSLNGHDPADHDVLFCRGSIELTAVDAYIAAGGKVCGVHVSNGDNWTRYGIDVDGWQQQNAPSYLVQNLHTITIGAFVGGPFRYVTHTDNKLGPCSQTIPGTVTLYYNEFSESPIATWEP